VETVEADREEFEESRIRVPTLREKSDSDDMFAPSTAAAAAPACESPASVVSATVVEEEDKGKGSACKTCTSCAPVLSISAALDVEDEDASALPCTICTVDAAENVSDEALAAANWRARAESDRLCAVARSDWAASRSASGAEGGRKDGATIVVDVEVRDAERVEDAEGAGVTDDSQESVVSLVPRGVAVEDNEACVSEAKGDDEEQGRGVAEMPGGGVLRELADPSVLMVSEAELAGEGVVELVPLEKFEENDCSGEKEAALAEGGEDSDGSGEGVEGDENDSVAEAGREACSLRVLPAEAVSNGGEGDSITETDKVGDETGEEDSMIEVDEVGDGTKGFEADTETDAEEESARESE
jgi:hypothetical protein